MLNIPIKHELGRVFLGKLNTGIWDLLNPIYDDLKSQVQARLRDEGFSSGNARVTRELELRHPGQIGTLRVTLAEDETDNTQRAKEDFLAAYERSYGHRDTTSEIEIAGLRVIGLGLFPPFKLRNSEIGSGVPKPRANRHVYFDVASGWIATSVYHGTELGAGHIVRGPAIIDEATTSIILAPGDVCTVDTLGNFLIRFEQEDVREP